LHIWCDFGEIIYTEGGGVRGGKMAAYCILEGGAEVG
jgi:hypothetical protein